MALGGDAALSFTSFVPIRTTRPFLVPLGDRGTVLIVDVQPVANERFDHQTRVAQVPGAILFEVRPELGVKAVRPLLGLGLPHAFGQVTDGFRCHGETLGLTSMVCKVRLSFSQQ